MVSPPLCLGYLITGSITETEATEVPGTFRVNGSAKRMRDLQALFEEPPKVCLCLSLKNRLRVVLNRISVR